VLTGTVDCRGRERGPAINKIVVGLGNPGEQYRQTRHNVGWMVLDRLADRAGWDGKGRSKDASSVVGGRFRGLDVLLVKPQTYMNESGIAVRKVLARERAPLTEMLVVVDDFALPFGKLRFREGGGPGGHNGLRSIIGEMESEAFSRLRVGIGAPNDRFIDHVLTKFEPDERQRLDELLDAAADAVEAWAREGTNKAATRFNAFDLRPADEDLVAPTGAVDGPPGPDGIRRTKTGWRKIRAKIVGSDEERE
jgi:PTH1 family peptidyl-tRNA hydrolase